MGGMSISPEASVEQDGVPAQRRAHERSVAERVRRDLAMVRAASEQLADQVARLDDRAMREPSGLPGWSRAHVVSHLARNADGLVNLITWARTGVEHPMYASNADRDADIEEGAGRLAQVLHEDLGAARDRLMTAAQNLPDTQWLATVTARGGMVIPASRIPEMRLFEIWVHLVDLGTGFRFTDIPAGHLERLLDVAVAKHVDHPDGPSIRLTVELPGGGDHRWDVVGGRGGEVHEVTGGPAEVLAWLTGRSEGEGLRGDVPRLPPWG
jgi:maleylpyruvate isomerase